MVTAHGIEVAWFYRRERKSGCCGTGMEAAEEAAATKEEEEEEEGGGCASDDEGGDLERRLIKCVAHTGKPVLRRCNSGF
jgi:hypothetical protein